MIYIVHFEAWAYVNTEQTLKVWKHWLHYGLRLYKNQLGIQSFSTSRGAPLKKSKKKLMLASESFLKLHFLTIFLPTVTRFKTFCSLNSCKEWYIYPTSTAKCTKHLLQILVLWNFLLISFSNFPKFVECNYYLKTTVCKNIG